MVKAHAECQPIFMFFPVRAKEVLCYALQTLATGSEPAPLDCEGYCGTNKLGRAGGMGPQENFLN